MVPLPARPQPTVEAIYRVYEERQDSGYRPHLGASLIGTPCERALWYTLRWATRANHSGRLLRLFERGQQEEDRFVDALRAIGATVMTVDPATGKQWEFRDASGHFGGSADAVGHGLPEAPKTWALIEMKTHALKSFTDLAAKGVKLSKPLHWAQMQTYGYLGGIDRALYIAVCKNDDSLYTEWIHIDKDEGARLVAKAQRIVDAQRPLSRISSDPNWYQCKWCDHNAVCWGDSVPERTCRSCIFSTPVPNGQWHCEKHDKMLSLAEQKEGCSSHRYIPDFIKGEQTDGADDGSWIEYITVDGTVWRDVGPVEEVQA